MPIAPHIPRCHHVRTNGVRCGSPSMRGRSLCFFHTRVSERPPARPQTMPLLEDGNAIQLGIASVIRRVLMYDIDYKAAYVLLHAYKLALFNLKNVRNQPFYKDVITLDPASDPENAGAATEPCTYEQIEELAEELRAVAPQAAVLHTEHSDVESEGRHYLAQDVSPGTDGKSDSSPVGTAPQNGERKQVQRIIIPDEIQNIIDRGPDTELSEEEFMKVASTLFGSKTG